MLLPIRRARPAGMLAIPNALLDASSRTPSPALLSADEAKTRLREIVEGFFFRRFKGEDGKQMRRLLAKSPPGLLLSSARPAANQPYTAGKTALRSAETLGTSHRGMRYRLAD
jgi:hypothetical protein